MAGLERRTDARLSKAQVNAAYTLYKRGLSLRQVAALLWERFGFATPGSAERSIRHAFTHAGLPRRTIKQAQRLRFAGQPKGHRNGQAHREGYCQGRTSNYPNAGAPCRRRVQRGQRWCSKHDPQRREQTAALAQRARAARSVADTAEPVTAQAGVVGAEPDRDDLDAMGHG